VSKFFGLGAKAAVGLVLVVAVFVGVGVSNELTFIQRMLVGLSGVCVMVSPIDKEGKRLGLTEEQIKTDVELQLQKAGIRVLTEKESLHTKGSPSLVIEVSAHQMEPTTGLAVYWVHVNLLENAKLVRGPYYSVITWNGQIMGSVGKKNTREIHKELADLVDEFINDYLKANARPFGKEG
jgi:hypothetical protein